MWQGQGLRHKFFSQGSKLIARRLHREKILLILDDVDDYEQLDVLAGGINWFGQGSRVIITTRDDQCLNTHKVDKDIQIYKLEGLNFENSLKLFNEEEWKNTVGGLNDILDNKVSGMSLKSYDDKVFARLMISYNKLGEYAKIIFLDIACHFAGWYAETPISIWEACELRPRLVIKELTEKHLLKMDNYRLKMHDQLRYLGRRIISKDSTRDPTKRTRLWSPDEILKILKKDMVTQMVEGLLLATEEDLSWEDFAKMPNLRFLNVGGTNNLKGDFSHLPSKLRWFRWCCPLTILPANFYHEELVYLDLSSSHIKLAWNDVPQNKNKRFQKLKVLILTKCWGLSDSPDFSWFPCLERLDLSECDLKHLVEFSVSGTNIEELPDGVGRLEKLEKLDVSWCFKLARLPTSMGGMKSILHFYMKYTMIVKLPDDFSKLSSLEVLSMILRLRGDKRIWPYYSTKVKFWTVMFENKVTDQQVPIQQSSASLVADFFRWSNVEDDEEGASTSRASNYRGASWPSSIEETGWLTRCQGLLREWILKTRVGRSIEGWVLERLPHNDDETSVDSGAL
ncbi:disease resistance protein Roq1-like [Macadamia integrifolia]|uniref:disease resistance protein Roq1-like n=1 Tax=Macadamia integrifolia TaxID=60698 RepID=UPI001C4EE12A|nr:disease resistance protein Roq1-like [Macadamia integrifolia]